MTRLPAGLLFMAFPSILQVLSHPRLPPEPSLFVPVSIICKALLHLPPVTENQSFLSFACSYSLSPSSLLSFHSMFLSWHFLPFPQVCLLLSSYKKVLQETVLSVSSSLPLCLPPIQAMSVICDTYKTKADMKPCVGATTYSVTIGLLPRFSPTY